MITLYQFPPIWGLPSLSPFCTKVEAYFRLTGLEYASRAGDVRKAPKGKLPYIEHEGRLLGDSSAILEYCKGRFGDPLDARLTPAERARGLLVQRTCEESLYFPLVWSRWMPDDAFAALVRDGLRPLLPGPLKAVLPPLIRRKVRTQLRHQGIGRHPPDRIRELAAADLDALSATIGAGPFLFGDAPTTYDLVLFAFALGATASAVPDPLVEHARSLAPLVAFRDRMKARCFPAN